jgi:hypothetical protein
MVGTFHPEGVVWILGHVAVWHAKRKISEYARCATTGIIRMVGDNIGRALGGAANDTKSANIVRNTNGNFGWPAHRPST